MVSTKMRISLTVIEPLGRVMGMLLNLSSALRLGKSLILFLWHFVNPEYAVLMPLSSVKLLTYCQVESTYSLRKEKGGTNHLSQNSPAHLGKKSCLTGLTLLPGR
jgi:hypothetical protein